MKALRTNKIHRSRGAFILVLFCMLSTAIHTQHVHAGGLGGGQPVAIVADSSRTGIVNTLKNTLSEVSTKFISSLTDSLALKELTLDGIARNLAQTALSQLQADMINWINGGFDGSSPAFVTNLEEHLLSIADQAAGEFIYGPELDNLCEPIRFQVKSALLTQYTQEGRETYTPQCTIESVAGGNSEAFLAGDFGAGGWGAYFELMVGSNNDPVKAYLDGGVEMYTRALDSQLQEQEQLAWSGGFFSKRACEFIEDATGFSRQRCENVTPGSIIQDTLSYFVGELPAQRLLQIDEFNEVFGSLASSLTNHAVQGTFGLLGLGGNNQYSDTRFGDGSQTYLEALAAERPTIDTSMTLDIERAIEAEEEYQDLQQIVLDTIEDLEEQLEEGEEDNPSCFDLELTDTLEDDKEDAEANIETSMLVLDALLQIQAVFEDASSSQEQQVAINQLRELQKQDLIRTEYDNTRLEFEFIEITFAERVDEFQTEIDEELDRCGGRSGS